MLTNRYFLITDGRRDLGVWAVRSDGMEKCLWCIGGFNPKDPTFKWHDPADLLMTPIINKSGYLYHSSDVNVIELTEGQALVYAL